MKVQNPKSSVRPLIEKYSRKPAQISTARPGRESGVVEVLVETRCRGPDLPVVIRYVAAAR